MAQQPRSVFDAEWAEPAAARRWQFDDVLVSDDVVAPMSGRAAVIHPLNDDQLGLYFLIDGDFAVSHGGRRLRFVAGTAAFRSSSADVFTEWAEPAHVIVICVSLRRLASLGSSLPSDFSAFATAIARRSPILTFIDVLLELSEESEISGEPAATALCGLIADLFLDDESHIRPATGVDLGLRAIADSLITLAAVDDTFRAKSLTQQMDITLRKLEENVENPALGGPMKHVMRDRLVMKAVLDIQSPARNALSGDELARRAGFADSQELSRALKFAYRRTVRQILLDRGPAPS